MFNFITRQPFWVNLLAAVVLVFAFGFLALKSLGWFTNHGSYLKVPGVTGQKVDDAIQHLEKSGFEVIITDSLYNDSLPLNTIKKQIPSADATVKVNRTVFLNVNPKVLPLIDMPRLEGLSFRFALENIRKNHLVLGDTTYRTDFMKGSILEQRYKGNQITPGTKIRWGSSIDLVIGGGLVEVQIPIPDLLGLTVSEAREQLQAKGLLLAAILTTGPVTDTANAFVIRQNPDAVHDDETPAYIRPGQTMDIWISTESPATDSLKSEN
ncbi:MAG: PASTA domain-containing protein [Ginsengibacter sp.]